MPIVYLLFFKCYLYKSITFIQINVFNWNKNHYKCDNLLSLLLLETNFFFYYNLIKKKPNKCNLFYVDCTCKTIEFKLIWGILIQRWHRWQFVFDLFYKYFFNKLA